MNTKCIIYPFLFNPFFLWISWKSIKSQFCSFCHRGKFNMRKYYYMRTENPIFTIIIRYYFQNLKCKHLLRLLGFFHSFKKCLHLTLLFFKLLLFIKIKQSLTRTRVHILSFLSYFNISFISLPSYFQTQTRNVSLSGKKKCIKCSLPLIIYNFRCSSYVCVFIFLGIFYTRCTCTFCLLFFSLFVSPIISFPQRSTHNFQHTFFSLMIVIAAVTHTHVIWYYITNHEDNDERKMTMVMIIMVHSLALIFPFFLKREKMLAF